MTEMKVRIKDGKIIWGFWGETRWWLRRRYSELFGAAVSLADCMPWFARKRLINWLCGQELFTDFCQTDHVLRGEGLACLKW